LGGCLSFLLFCGGAWLWEIPFGNGKMGRPVMANAGGVLLSENSSSQVAVGGKRRQWKEAVNKLIHFGKSGGNDEDASATLMLNLLIVNYIIVCLYSKIPFKNGLTENFLVSIFEPLPGRTEGRPNKKKFSLFFTL
jgi:hypothetical protein